jgi:hypothetical protein
LEGFRKVEQWKSGSLDLEGFLSERGIAFADPAILDRWKIRKMGDWNVVAEKPFLNRGLFRQDDNSIYLA